MHSLLYISLRTARPGSGSGDVDAIVAISRPRNGALGVTGALVATPTHFAQMLEGPEAALTMLIESIDRDPRHSAIRLIRFDPKPHRDMSRWSLTYSGESSYVADMVGSAVGAPDFQLREQADQIRALMMMFA